MASIRFTSHQSPANAAPYAWFAVTEGDKVYSGMVDASGVSHLTVSFKSAYRVGGFLMGDTRTRSRAIKPDHKAELRAEVLAAYRHATRGRDLGVQHDMHVEAEINSRTPDLSSLANCAPLDAPAVTCNHAQGRYVIRGEKFTSCLGFDVADRRRRAVLNFLGYGGIQSVPMGTVEGYNAYKAAMELGSDHYDRTGERCPAELVHDLIGLEGARVEVVDCDGETRRFIVGKSTGWMPCHLEIKRKGSHGGGAVMGAPFRSVRVIERRA